MNSELKKAKILLYLQALLQFQGFIGPVIFIFYTRYMGLSPSQYYACDSLLFVLMAISEIPSGLISDYFGRKKMLVLSQISISIGMVVLLTVPSYEGAIVVAFIYGFFGALQSGNAESILYETFENYKNIKQFEYIKAKIGGYAFIISIAYSLSSGYLADYKLALPVILDLVVCVALLLATIILLKEPKDYSRGKRKALPEKKEISNVINVIIIASILFSCTRVMFSFYQPILLAIKIPVFFLGYASACYSLISAGSAFFYKKIRESTSTKSMYLLLVILQLLATFGIAYVNSYLAVVFIFVQQVQRGLMGPFLFFQVNRYIDTNSRNRVSLMSIMYFVISILTSFSLFVTSKIINVVGLRLAIIYYVIVVNLFLIISIVFFARKNKLNKLVKYDADR